MCQLIRSGVGVQDLRGYHLKLRCPHCGAEALALGGDLARIEYEAGHTACPKGVPAPVPTPPKPMPSGQQGSLF